MYAVGESVFLSITKYQRQTLVHIRRYNQYGKRFYPTKEGITLAIDFFDDLMKYPIPQTVFELFEMQNHFADVIDITMHESNIFELIKRSHDDYLRPDTSIVINGEQWKRMRDYHDQIMESLIADYMGAFDFKDMFVVWCKVSGWEGELQDSTALSIDDVIAGHAHLTNMVKASIIDVLLERGGLIMPKREIGAVLSSNTIKEFNTAARNIRMQAVVESFYSKVTDETVSDSLFPHYYLPLLFNVTKYVTLDFLDAVDFRKLIHEIRIKMCPTIGETLEI